MTVLAEQQRVLFPDKFVSFIGVLDGELYVPEGKSDLDHKAAA